MQIYPSHTSENMVLDRICTIRRQPGWWGGGGKEEATFVTASYQPEAAASEGLTHPHGVELLLLPTAAVLVC